MEYDFIHVFSRAHHTESWFRKNMDDIFVHKFRFLYSAKWGIFKEIQKDKHFLNVLYVKTEM